MTVSTSYLTMFSSFSVVTPPSSRPFGITFTSLFLSSGTFYDIDSSSISITPVAGSLNNLTLTAASYFVNDNTTYTLVFATANALVAGSYVGVTLPSTVSLAAVGSCSANLSALACSITNSSYLNFSSAGAIPAGTAVALTFSPVTNPSQAITTASIAVRTYYDSGIDSMVDSATTGLTLTTVSRALSTVTVTPASLVTYASTNYLFTMALLDPIPVGGSIAVTFPPAITLGSVALVSASFATVSCLLTLNANLITLGGCFAGGLAAGSYTFTLSGITNPRSLQPTASLAVETVGSSGVVNYMNSSLIVTMATPATTTSFALAPTSTAVHATTAYTLSFTFAVPHQSGDYFTFSIDSSMAFLAPVCAPVSGITSLSCVASNATRLVITLGAVPSASAQISIASIRNYDVSGTAVPFAASFFSAGNYAMESSSAVTQSYTAEAITTATLNNNDQIALY
jgi:hypothetical protein